jgi:hypothetical protein
MPTTTTIIYPDTLFAPALRLTRRLCFDKIRL